MTSTLEQGHLCRGVRLIHKDGTVVYPVAIQNRKTRQVAYILAKPGTNSHHRDAAIEVFNEEEVARGIVDQRLKARCRAEDGSHDALYGPDARNVVRVERVTTGLHP
jgi:hypothetical protein